jgi:hypothetical protein
MKFRLLALLWLCLSLWWAPVMAASPKDTQLISAAMKKQFDKPEAPLEVGPVSVEGNYAVAGWTQGRQGGRALLQKGKDGWFIAVCAGDALTQTEVLKTTGMDATSAQKLANGVLAAEARLSVDKRRRFASFQGVLKVDAPGAAHGPGAHPHPQ